MDIFNICEKKLFHLFCFSDLGISFIREVKLSKSYSGNSTKNANFGCQKLFDS